LVDSRDKKKAGVEDAQCVRKREVGDEDVEERVGE
jgi:hypothetical protein